MNWGRAIDGLGWSGRVGQVLGGAFQKPFPLLSIASLLLRRCGCPVECELDSTLNNLFLEVLCFALSLGIIPFYVIPHVLHIHCHA